MISHTLPASLPGEIVLEKLRGKSRVEWTERKKFGDSTPHLHSYECGFFSPRAEKGQHIKTF